VGRALTNATSAVGTLIAMRRETAGRAMDGGRLDGRCIWVSFREKLMHLPVAVRWTGATNLDMCTSMWNGGPAGLDAWTEGNQQVSPNERD
jgi:hypothetical protein